MIALTILASVLVIIGYLCVSVKVGFWVLEKTENTGFNVGFYMMAVFFMLALPFAIFAQFYVR